MKHENIGKRLSKYQIIKRKYFSKKTQQRRRFPVDIEENLAKFDLRKCK